MPKKPKKIKDQALTKAERRIQQVLHAGKTGLDLSELGLETLPESIGQLSRLKDLYLSHNQLTALPEAIGGLIRLQSLDLQDNQLTALPESIGQLNQLQWLDLSFNQLMTLPECIGQLKQIESLFLFTNQLTKLPESISQLNQLESLDLRNNQLTRLPQSFGHLTQLLDLDLTGNRLTMLPESMGRLTRLERLNLSENQLTALPESIKELSSLRRLLLHGNDALGLPPEVLGPTRPHLIRSSDSPANPAEIIAYYFRTREGRRPLNEAKLILVGYGAVGKTSLVNRLVHNRFDKDEKETPGIQITQWPIRLRQQEVVRLHIWDFGGQEIMHSTHHFFLTQRSLYVLVLNGRQGHEDHDAEYWLSLIKSFGEDSPVIVVLNKITEHPFNVNQGGLREKFSAIRAFVQTDCEDGTGIAELRRGIERETDRLEHLRDAFPATWFSIKDWLAGMDENYLTFDRYREICREYGESDMRAQDALAFYLHSLGIALNYKDDPRLSDTHVLNPHWVTNGIYGILKAPQLSSQEGELRVKDVADILDPADYPPERHNFLLDLMRKFELCFSFPDDDGHYLIPELLDKQQPPAAQDFNPKTCLNFQYHYPVLPEGLLPRFIVRSHGLSTGQPRWRTGVILEFEGNRALVKADKQDRRVHILVDGDTLGRRRLLAVIRSDFERIHRSFKFPPQEMVPLPGHPEAMVKYQDLRVRERSGRMKFDEVIGDQVIEFDAEELLNGIDLEGTRKAKPSPEKPGQTMRLFYSYSHKDEALRDELETHLKLLQRQGLIEFWHDRRITAGEEWKGQIDANLEQANLILLLVSADFIASDYCYDIEMKRAMERHEAGKARVIPVIVRDVIWQVAPFGKLQPLPTDGKAVTTWPNKDTAWRNVAEGIEKAIKDLREK